MDVSWNKLPGDGEGLRSLAGYSPRDHKESDMTLPTKVGLVKAMVFPVVMYECESWTIKKAERRTSDAVGGDSSESLGQSKKIKPVNLKRKSTMNVHRND